MQAALSISVNTNSIAQGQDFMEYEFPKLKEYLDHGYKVKEVHQSTTSANSYLVLLTFILEKNVASGITPR